MIQKNLPRAIAIVNVMKTKNILMKKNASSAIVMITLIIHMNARAKNKKTNRISQLKFISPQASLYRASAFTYKMVIQ